MVTGRTKGLTLRGKGNVVLVAAQLDDPDGNPTEQYVLLRADEFGRLRTIDAAHVATFLGLTDTPASYVGAAGQVVRVNLAASALEFAGTSPGWPQIDDLGATTWGRPGWGWTDTGGTAMVAEELYYVPIYVERTRTFTQIGIHVLGAGAPGSAGRLGIYEGSFDGDGDLTPGDLVLDAGAVSVATVGEKALAISQELSPGFYFLAASSDDVPSCSRPIPDRISTQPVTSRNTTVDGTNFAAFSVVVADGAAALPDPATAPTALESMLRHYVCIGE